MMEHRQRLRLTLILGALAALGPLSIDMYLPSFPSVARSLDPDRPGRSPGARPCLNSAAGAHGYR
jgi:DHA1 family bicyclomycin/chloramphenicol resistance-like MFS transporter